MKARSPTIGLVREMAASPANFVAEESWPAEHPWMTFFLVVIGLGTVAGVIEVVAVSRAAAGAAGQVTTPTVSPTPGTSV